MGQIWQNSILYSGGGGVNISSAVKTLSASGWDILSRQQTITVSGITSSSIIWVAPVSNNTSNYANYTGAGIRAISQTTNSITFICDNLPSVNISVNICYC